MKMKLSSSFASIEKKGLLLLILGLCLGGCSSVKPWVKPYERNKLADPIMSFETSPLGSAFMSHMYLSRESARGAQGGSGGGCGCN